MKASLALSATFALALAPGLPVGLASADERRVAFSYRAEIGPVPRGSGPVHVFIPVPPDTPKQTVESLRIEAAFPGEIESEPIYGNRFWHGQLAESNGEPLVVTLEATVLRRAAGQPRAGAGAEERLDDAELARYLGPNQRVVVGHEVLDPILAEIRAETNGRGRAITARVTYDWVVDNVTYKKVGTGWGNGDTFWACSERYGNCTDFHSLLISLARTEGIPARFQMGFPVPEERPAGEVGGYHCWVDLHLPETGWFPVDASEASKHPEKRELLYGSQPADRILFSTGRDLRLGPDHRGEPLNYFVYPHVEVAGEVWTGPLERAFRYRDLGAEPRPARGPEAGAGQEMSATGPATTGRIVD